MNILEKSSVMSTLSHAIVLRVQHALSIKNICSSDVFAMIADYGISEVDSTAIFDRMVAMNYLVVSNDGFYFVSLGRDAVHLAGVFSPHSQDA